MSEAKSAEAPAAHAPPKTSFSLAWFAVAFVVMFVLRGGVEIYAALCSHLLHDWSLGLSLGVGYFVFSPFCVFVTALFIGWKSDGRTYFEVAIPALIVSSLSALLVVVFRLHAPQFMFACGCAGISEFFVALIGAAIGERLQGRS